MPRPNAPRRSVLARLLVQALALAALTLTASADPDPRRIFDVPGGRVTSIVVTRSTDPPTQDDLGSDMLRQLAGVIGQISERDATRLRTMVRAAEPPSTLAGARLVGVIHLINPRQTKRVEILRVDGVGLVASEIDPIDDSGQPAAAVLPKAFEDIVAHWSTYDAGFTDTDTPLAECVDMPHPYIPSPFTFDQQTMSERFAGGGRHTVRDAVRDLDAETFWVRLPRGYDPRHPAGLLVWIDPSESGRPPAFMHPAADEHNFIIVGASEAGNDRIISDRHQLEFDAMANVMHRYHVDPSRVYASGVSGGGRVASMYWACFPDVFTGAVPIVGLAHPQPVRTMQGTYPPEYVMPRTSREILRRHRMGVITGKRDFNYAEIEGALAIMDIDRYAARLFSYDDMGHEYPTPERFAEALDWVDQPWRQTRADAVSQAARLLDAVIRRRTDPDAPAATTSAAPLSPADRATLVRITDIAPWTDEAWEAARMLEASPASPP